MKIEVGSFQQSIWLFSNFFTVDALQWVLICSTMIFTLGVCAISSSTCLYLRSSCPQTFNLFPYRAQTREPSYLSLPMCLYVSSLSQKVEDWMHCLKLYPVGGLYHHSLSRTCPNTSSILFVLQCNHCPFSAHPPINCAWACFSSVSWYKMIPITIDPGEREPLGQQ